jgi:hypothetical protein
MPPDSAPPLLRAQLVHRNGCLTDCLLADEQGEVVGRLPITGYTVAGTAHDVTVVRLHLYELHVESVHGA